VIHSVSVKCFRSDDVGVRSVLSVQVCNGFRLADARDLFVYFVFCVHFILLVIAFCLSHLLGSALPPPQVSPLRPTTYCEAYEVRGVILGKSVIFNALNEYCYLSLFFSCLMS
jgi:hypothetical protein